MNNPIPLASKEPTEPGTGSVIKFFALTYGVSWLLFAVAAWIFAKVRSSPGGLSPIANFLFLPGTIVPALVAISLTARSEGRTGVAALLGGITKWRLGARWYVFALGFMAAIKLAAALVYRIAMGEWPMFGQISWYLIAVAIIFSTPVQAGEEIGWRAFALPRLAKQVGWAWASIILGLVWAGWHLPFFFIPGSDNFGRSFPLYAAAVTAVSVAMAWLYWRTNGSLFMTMLMHASINNSAGIVVSTPSAAGTNPFGITAPLLTWLTVTLLWVSVGWLLIRMRRNRTAALADEPRLHQPGKNPPDAERAERKGHEALEIVPCWHYAHDLLLPQIAEAKAKQAKQSP